MCSMLCQVICYFLVSCEWLIYFLFCAQLFWQIIIMAKQIPFDISLASLLSYYVLLTLICSSQSNC